MAAVCSILGRAERKERICRELLDLRDGKVKESHSRQVVKKCPSPVAPTYKLLQDRAGRQDARPTGPILKQLCKTDQKK